MGSYGALGRTSGATPSGSRIWARSLGMLGGGVKDGGPVGRLPRYQHGGMVVPMPSAPPIVINNTFNIQTPSAESFARSRLQVEAMMGRSMERALRRGGA